MEKNLKLIKELLETEDCIAVPFPDYNTYKAVIWYLSFSQYNGFVSKFLGNYRDYGERTVLFFRKSTKSFSLSYGSTETIQNDNQKKDPYYCVLPPFTISHPKCLRIF